MELLSREKRQWVEESWEKIASNIREIQHHHIDIPIFSEPYNLVFDLMTCNFIQAQVGPLAPMLYNGVTNLVIEDLDRLTKEIIFPNLPSGVGLDPVKRRYEDEKVLEAVYNAWSDHMASVKKVSHIVKLLNDRYARPASLLGIVDVGRDQFVQRFLCPQIKDHVINAILGLIDIERRGHLINRSAIKDCVNALSQLTDSSDGTTVYERHIEPRILHQAEAYYEAEAGKSLLTCGALEYLRKVQTCLSEEEARVHQLLPSQTLASIRATLENVFLTPHWQTLMDMASPGLNAMVHHDKLDDLSLQFSLAPVEVLFICRFLKTSIQKRGTELNRTSMEGRELVDSDSHVGTDTPTQGHASAKARARNVSSRGLTLPVALGWVEGVLQLKDKFDRIWEVSFKKDPKIEVALHEAFASFVNTHPRASEFISLYTDDNLKHGLKGKTDVEVEVILYKTIGLFRFITEKDVFERYYRAHLAKRLLHNQSANDDAERDMLAKFKVECGSQFTAKLEIMFHDVELSADAMQIYRDHFSRATAPRPEVDINVIVMTSASWPVSKAPQSCILPSVLVKACNSFEQFYLSRHAGRMLTWLPLFGNADVEVAFKKRKHILNVSSFALIILLLFENLGKRESLTYGEIKTATEIPDSELQRNLYSLACARFKVLRKHPLGRNINPDDSFSFNEGFSSSLQKIKIKTVGALFESDEEHKETHRDVKEERRYQIDACIVRIMKSKKHMTHNGLVNEVTLQLTSRFLPDPRDIKERIEALIEEEYLGRCEDSKSYEYLI